MFLRRHNEIFAMYIRLALAIHPSVRSWSFLHRDHFIATRMRAELNFHRTWITLKIRSWNEPQVSNRAHVVCPLELTDHMCMFTWIWVWRLLAGWAVRHFTVASSCLISYKNIAEYVTYCNIGRNKCVLTTSTAWQHMVITSVKYRSFCYYFIVLKTWTI